MQNIQRIAPCLWFDDQAEEAAGFYIALACHKVSAPALAQVRP